MKDIELRLWDYIDGFSSEIEKAEMEILIATDLSVKSKYRELLDLQSDFQDIGLDAPSMVFTNNVMAQINLINQPLSAKVRTNSAIIYAIAGFFGIMILACLILVVTEIDWTKGDSVQGFAKLEWSQFFSNTSGGLIQLIYGFLIADVVVGLLFLDRLLRNKLTTSV